MKQPRASAAFVAVILIAGAATAQSYAATPDCGAANPRDGNPSMVTGTCP
jgi:hypothetical protein